MRASRREEVGDALADGSATPTPESVLPPDPTTFTATPAAGLILAIDAASIRSGYAVMTGADTLVDAGTVGAPAGWSPADRVALQIDDLADIVAEHRPVRMVVELPATKPHARARGRGGSTSGLGTLGFAAGGIWHAGFAFCALPPVGVPVDRWTLGRGRPQRKAQRVAETAARFDLPRDIKHLDDVADAIALGRWWFLQGGDADGAPARKGAA